VISASVEKRLAEALRREAARRRVTLSRLIEEALKQWLSSASEQASEQLREDPLTSGEGESESGSERRRRLIAKLDQPTLERLPKDVEVLAKWVQRLQQTPVSMRRTDRFLRERARARRKLEYLKKEARRLLAAGYEIDESIVDKLVELERTLNAL